MSILRVHSFSISIDGYGAGPNQDLENPIGVGGLNYSSPRRCGLRLPGGRQRVCSCSLLPRVVVP